MQIDKQPFPMNIVDLDKVKVLVRPEQANTTWDKNVIISEKRTIATSQKCYQEG